VLSAASYDEGVQSEKDAYLRSRLFGLESKLEEIKQLLSQRSYVEGDSSTNFV